MTLYYVFIILGCSVTTEAITNKQSIALLPTSDRDDRTTKSEDYSEPHSGDQSSYAGFLSTLGISTSLRFVDFTTKKSNELVSGYITVKEAIASRVTTSIMKPVSTRTVHDNHKTEHTEDGTEDHPMTSSTFSFKFGIRDSSHEAENGQDDFTTLQALYVDNESTRHVSPFANLITPSNNYLRIYTLKRAMYQSTETQTPTTHVQDQYQQKMTKTPMASNSDTLTSQNMNSFLHGLGEVTTRMEKKHHLYLTTQSSIKQGRQNVDVCDQYGGCPTLDKEFFWFCQCDDKCLEYNDCCQDYVQSATGQQEQEIYTCFRVDQEKTNLFGIYVIATCPKPFLNITINEKCISYTNLQYGPPVIDKHNVAQVFANIYCALCNGVSEVKLVSIQIYDLPFDMILQEMESFQSKSDLLYLNNNVKFRLKGYEQYNFRKCMHSMQVSNEKECQQYINPVLDGSRGLTVYRNTHCIGDSILDSLVIQNAIQCLAKFIHRGYSDASWNYNQLSIIFNFGQNEENIENNGMCSVWFTEVEQLCTNLPIYVNVQESMEFVLQIPSDMSEMTDDLMIQVGLAAIWTYYVPNVVRVTMYSTIAKDGIGLSIKGDLKVTVRKQCFKWELERILNALKQRRINFVVRTTHEKNNVLFSNISDSPVVNFTILEKFYFDFEISTMYKTLSSRSIKLMPGVRINNICTNITINSKLMENVLVIVNVICDSPTTTTGISPLDVLTYAEFTLSTIALVPLIVVNRRMNQRMTLPRTNIENISLSLICTNCLFMVGIGMVHMANICYGVGITLHYLFLTTFVFMTIGVLSVSYAVIRLEQQRNSTKEKIKRERLLITILGLTLPLILVYPAVLMDRFGPPEWSPGYGYTACFPTRFPGNVAFFSGPVVLLLAVDLICLICIIIHVRRIRRNARTFLNISRTIDDAKLYLRLVILSGALWLVGIVAVIVKSEWLDYLFTISCGLQGFFMSVAGLSTKEAIEKMKIRRKEEQTETKNL